MSFSLDSKTFSHFEFFVQGLQGQIEELIDEKTKLNDEYQRLNLAYEKTFQEHQKLLNFCSNYQHQLNETKTFIQTSGLKVRTLFVFYYAQLVFDSLLDS